MDRVTEDRRSFDKSPEYQAYRGIPPFESDYDRIDDYQMYPNKNIHRPINYYYKKYFTQAHYSKKPFKPEPFRGEYTSDRRIYPAAFEWGSEPNPRDLIMYH